MRGHGHLQVREPDARDLVPIPVHGGREARVRGALAGRVAADAALGLGPQVHLPQHPEPVRVRLDEAGDHVQGGQHLRAGHGSAVVDDGGGSWGAAGRPG